MKGNSHAVRQGCFEAEELHLMEQRQWTLYLVDNYRKHKDPVEQVVLQELRKLAAMRQ